MSIVILIQISDAGEAGYGVRLASREVRMPRVGRGRFFRTSRISGGRSGIQLHRLSC